MMQRSRLRWYGHVLRKDDDDRMKKLLRYIEGTIYDKRLGTMDVNELHLNPSDAIDRNKRSEVIRRNWCTITMILMLRAEYELYVSGAGWLTHFN